MNEANFTREFQIERKQEEQGKKQYTVSFASQAPYDRFFGTEILDVSPSAIDLTRLREIGCLLFNHDTDKVIGRPENIRIQDGKAYADIVFDADDFSKQIEQKVDSGTLKGVSVRYFVKKWEILEAGVTSNDQRFTGPAQIARLWTPLEISIVSIPADSTVGVNRGYQNNEEEKQLNENENNDQATTTAQASAPANPQATQLQQRSLDPKTEPKTDHVKLAELERARAIEIVAIQKSTGIDLSRHIELGTTADEVRRLALENLVRTNKPVAVTMGERDHSELFRAMGDAVALRAGIKIDNPTKGCGDFRNMTLRELAIEACERSGMGSARNFSTDELYGRAFTPDVALGSILTNTVNSAIARAYATTPLTFKEWTGIGSLSNFKPTEFWRISEAGDLDVVKQNGEFKYDEVSDEKVSISLQTKGLEWGFTRQAMINDDLNVLSRIPQAYVQSALRGVNKAVYAILNTNPKIYDSKALFSTDHNNLSGLGDGINTESLTEARAAMRKHKNIRGLQALNIAPAFLIVAPEMEQEALIMVKSMAKPDGANSGVFNTFENSMRVIVDGELTDNAGKSWFLAGDPSMVDSVVVSYLNANQMPQLFTQPAWNGQGVKWAINYDVGVNIVDYRGLYKNPGKTAK